MVKKPIKIVMDKIVLPEKQNLDSEGWIWKPMKKGGLLTIYHITKNEITIF